MHHSYPSRSRKEGTPVSGTRGVCAFEDRTSSLTEVKGSVRTEYKDTEDPLHPTTRGRDSRSPSSTTSFSMGRDPTWGLWT